MKHFMSFHVDNGHTMNPSLQSTNSPGRQRVPAPVRYRPPPPQPASDDEEDDSDEDELVRPGSSGSDTSSNVTTVSAAPVTPINPQIPPGQLLPPSTSLSHHLAARSPYARPLRPPAVWPWSLD